MKQQRQLDQMAFPGMDSQQPAAARAADSVLLPVPERLLIDVQRTQRILGTSHSNVLTLIRRKAIAAFQMAGGGRWHIEYDSVLEFCDGLRTRFLICDRRPVRRGLRWRDEELLPFPMRDTVRLEDAMQLLNLGYRATTALIEQGGFEAYQLSSLSESAPWRISRRSLEEYAARIGADFRSTKQEAAAQARSRGNL